MIEHLIHFQGTCSVPDSFHQAKIQISDTESEADKFILLPDTNPSSRTTKTSSSSVSPIHIPAHVPNTISTNQYCSSINTTPHITPVSFINDTSGNTVDRRFVRQSLSAFTMVTPGSSIPLLGQGHDIPVPVFCLDLGTESGRMLDCTPKPRFRDLPALHQV